MHHTAARNGEADHAGVVRFIVGQHIAAGNGVFSYRDRIVGHIALILSHRDAQGGGFAKVSGVSHHRHHAVPVCIRGEAVATVAIEH